MRVIVTALTWAAVGLWLAGIYYFSTLRYPLGPLSRSPRHETFNTMAHLTEYAGLTLLLAAALASTSSLRHGVARLSRRGAVLASGMALAWAVLDEYHQSFVPGRTSSLTDMGIDLLGVAAACVLVARLARRPGPSADPLRQD